MIISAPSNYRKVAERRLPRFLFDYIDGGAVTEPAALTVLIRTGRS
jgi:L-lactate dehydrogenase (cytochrome)